MHFFPVASKCARAGPSPPPRGSRVGRASLSGRARGWRRRRSSKLVRNQCDVVLDRELPPLSGLRLLVAIRSDVPDTLISTAVPRAEPVWLVNEVLATRSKGSSETPTRGRRLGTTMNV